MRELTDQEMRQVNGGSVSGVLGVISSALGMAGSIVKFFSSLFAA
ncbi:MAG: hypothetical protein ACQERJ_07905 [Bacillota bacterium]